MIDRPSARAINFRCTSEPHKLAMFKHVVHLHISSRRRRRVSPFPCFPPPFVAPSPSLLRAFVPPSLRAFVAFPLFYPKKQGDNHSKIFLECACGVIRAKSRGRSPRGKEGCWLLITTQGKNERSLRRPVRFDRRGDITLPPVVSLHRQVSQTRPGMGPGRNFVQNCRNGWIRRQQADTMPVFVIKVDRLQTVDLF